MQGAPEAGAIQPEPVIETEGAPIDVNARRGPTLSGESPDVAFEDRLLGNKQAIMAADDAVRGGANVSERKGMFGVKGTLRDILGIVGDAFLVQSGNKAVYGPARQEEMISDAMAGITEGDDESYLNAIERVNRLSPTTAREMYKEFEARKLRQAQTESLIDTRRTTQSKTRADMNKQGRLAAASLLSQPGAVVDGNITPDAMRVLELIAEQNEMTVDQLIGQGGLTGEQARLYGGAGMTAYQTAQVPIQQQRADATTAQAAASTLRAQKAPSGGRPVQESPTERLNRLSRIPPEQRTQEEQDYITRNTAPSEAQRSSAGTPSGTSGTTGNTRQFRPSGRKN
jgi:hypothetical protein